MNNNQVMVFLYLLAVYIYFFNFFIVSPKFKPSRVNQRPLSPIRYHVVGLETRRERSISQQNRKNQSRLKPMRVMDVYLLKESKLEIEKTIEPRSIFVKSSINSATPGPTYFNSGCCWQPKPSPSLARALR